MVHNSALKNSWNSPQDYCFTHITSISCSRKWWSRKGCSDNEKYPEKVHWPLHCPSQLPYNSTSTWLQSSRTDDELKTEKLYAYNPESTYSLQTRSRRIQEEGWTPEISRSTTMIFNTEQKNPTTSKRTTCVGEDSDNQRSSGDRKRFSLVCCYSDWQRYSMQKPQSTSTKKWEADISSNHNAKSVNTSEAEAGDSRWSKIWRACWRKGNHNSLQTSCGQETYHLTTCLLNRWKTAYTKSGRKVQAPQRLDVWKSCTLTCLLMWNFVWLLKFRSSCKIWISKTVLNPSRKTYFACS